MTFNKKGKFSKNFSNCRKFHHPAVVLPVETQQKGVNLVRKRILPLLAAVLLVLTIAAGAVEARIAVPAVSLSFQGTTAVCTASVSDPSKQIKATLELWCGTTLVDCWDASGTSRVNFNETTAVTSGKTYRLTLVGTSGGEPFTPQSITKTCP